MTGDPRTRNWTAGMDPIRSATNYKPNPIFKEQNRIEKLMRRALRGELVEWREKLILFVMAWPWRDLPTDEINDETAALLVEGLTNSMREQIFGVLFEVVARCQELADLDHGPWSMPIQLNKGDPIAFTVSPDWLVVDFDNYFPSTYKTPEHAQMRTFVQQRAIDRDSRWKNENQALRELTAWVSECATNALLENSSISWLWASKALEQLHLVSRSANCGKPEGVYAEIERLLIEWPGYCKQVSISVNPLLEADWKKAKPLARKAKAL